MGSLLLPPGSWWATTLCVPSKSGISVFPSPVEVLQSNPTSLQSLILWEFLSPLLDPQVGKRDSGLRTFTPVDGLLWYNCSPVCDSPTQQLWDLTLLWLRPSTMSLQLLLCLWMWGIFFGEFSVFLLMIVQQLVVILLFSQEGVRARPSTLPSWTNLSPTWLSEITLNKYFLYCCLPSIGRHSYFMLLKCYIEKSKIVFCLPKTHSFLKKFSFTGTQLTYSLSMTLHLWLFISSLPLSGNVNESLHTLDFNLLTSQLKC